MVFFSCIQVHFDKFKMFIMCGLATVCIKIQMPIEIAVDALVLATFYLGSKDACQDGVARESWV